MDSSLNLGSIGIAGPPLRGPSSTRLLAEPPLSPPVSAGASPTASAQPLEPTAPLSPLVAPMPDTVSSSEPAAPVARPASSLESLLMRFRLITPDQLDEALREQRETGRDVGAIVVERGWINEDQLARLLSYAPAFPEASEPASEPVEPAIEHEPEHEAEIVSEETVAVEAEADPEPEGEREPEYETAPALEENMPVEAEVDPEPESQPEPDPEPELPSAGPVISAAAEASAAPDFQSLVDVPPALELIEPEPWSKPDTENEEAPAVVAEESEPTPVAATSVALMPIAPIVSPEPMVSPEPIVSPEPVVEAEPVVTDEPAPVAEIAPEPIVEAEPVPVAETASEPVVEAEAIPVAEIAAEQVVVSSEAQTVKFVEPAAIETIARVFVRLSNGERVEAGSFDDIAAAKARADEVVRQVSNGDNGWPFFAGRYIRPEAIVSVDVDATVVRYA